MNKQTAKDLEYQSFGELFVLDEVPYFKGTLCNCWCECGSFIKINKDELIYGKRINCGSSVHDIIIKEPSKRKKSKYYINRRIKTRYNLLLHNRKGGKYVISLTLLDYIEFSKIDKCHYCDEIIDWLGKSSAYFLDRKDNNLGYTKENCVVCCSRCNMSKGSRFTYEEWCKIGKVIKDF